MSNATLNENMLSTTVLFLSNNFVSHYFQVHVPLQGVTPQEIPLQGILFQENFVYKVWMDQFSLPVLKVRPLQERRFYFIVLFSSEESYHLHQ
jgi:hypothetical protein